MLEEWCEGGLMQQSLRDEVDSIVKCEGILYRLLHNIRVQTPDLKGVVHAARHHAATDCGVCAKELRALVHI